MWYIHTIEHDLDEWNAIICSKMGSTRKHYTEWNKPDPKNQILYVSPDAWKLKKKKSIRPYHCKYSFVKLFLNLCRVSGYKCYVL